MTSAELAAASRDAYQALRRVERQQRLVERAHASRIRLQLADLAAEFGVSVRTVARDVERLRLAGVPLQTQRGRGGGISLERPATIAAVQLDLPEIAAVLSSLTSLGPSVGPSADSAMRKLVAALGG